MTDAPWRPERAVDPRAAAAALARHCDLDPRRVRAVGAGWDNCILEVDGLYLRIAVRAAADPLIRRERALLPGLADLPLAVPRPVAAGEPEPGLPGPWIAYRPVAGDELAGALAAGHALADAAALGRFLAALHEPARAAAAPPDTPRDPQARADSAALAGRVDAWARRAAAAGLEVPGAALARLLRDTDEGPPAAPPALVHGDLHMRHILVGDDRRPVGVIDWGDACVAPPVADLAVYWYALDPPGRAAFCAAYGAIDRATLAAARRFAAFSCLALQVAGADGGPAAVLAGAAAGLARALAGE